jgi:hypothetical protein
MRHSIGVAAIVAGLLGLAVIEVIVGYNSGPIEPRGQEDP